MQTTDGTFDILNVAMIGRRHRRDYETHVEMKPTMTARHFD
jgi:hypothetical protein